MVIIGGQNIDQPQISMEPEVSVIPVKTVQPDMDKVHFAPFDTFDTFDT